MFRRWGFHEGTVDAAPRDGAASFTIAWDDGSHTLLAPDKVRAAAALARRYHSASPPHRSTTELLSAVAAVRPRPSHVLFEPDEEKDGADGNGGGEEAGEDGTDDEDAGDGGDAPARHRPGECALCYSGSRKLLNHRGRHVVLVRRAGCTRAPPRAAPGDDPPAQYQQQLAHAVVGWTEPREDAAALGRARTAATEATAPLLFALQSCAGAYPIDLSHTSGTAAATAPVTAAGSVAHGDQATDSSAAAPPPGPMRHQPELCRTLLALDAGNVRHNANAPPPPPPPPPPAEEAAAAADATAEDASVVDDGRLTTAAATTALAAESPVIAAAGPVAATAAATTATAAAAPAMVVDQELKRKQNTYRQDIAFAKEQLEAGDLDDDEFGLFKKQACDRYFRE